MRDVQMQALIDHFGPDGNMVIGPKNGNPGTIYKATDKEADATPPHLAVRLTPKIVHVAEVAAGAERTWADTGMIFTPEQYLRKFPEGPEAELARAEIARAGGGAPKGEAAGGEEKDQEPMAPKAKAKPAVG